MKEAQRFNRTRKAFWWEVDGGSSSKSRGFRLGPRGLPDGGRVTPYLVSHEPASPAWRPGQARPLNTYSQRGSWWLGGAVGLVHPSALGAG